MLERDSLSRKIGIALRHPDKVLQRITLIADYLAFRRRYSFLREGAHLQEPSKTVLIVSLSNWVAQVKKEGMLAKALQVRGYRPVVATLRTARWAHRYFRAFGIRDLIFFDDLTAKAPGTVREEAEAILREPLTFASLYGLKYRDVYVGRHVLSSIVRTLRNGSISFDDSRVVTLMNELLPYTFRCVWASEALLEDMRPQIALFLEKGYVGYGEIFDVAVNRGIDAIQFPHSHRSDALMMKRYTAETRHLHHFSLSEESWQRVKEMPWSRENEADIIQELRGRYEAGTWFDRKFAQAGKELKGPEVVRAQLGLDPEKKTAVIFSHVLWDATFFFGENLFTDYEEWLVETVKVACANPAVNWVVKIHPDYVWKMKQLGDSSKPRDLIALSEQFGELPNHVKVLEPDTNISTYSIFGVTDYGITVRGTVGIELACLGVPVFTAGTGRYSGLGFTVDSATREEYLEKLRHIQDFRPLTSSKTELARRYAYAVFKLRPMEFKTFEMVQMPFEKLGHVLDHNVVIRANSFQDIATAPDLRQFAEWAADSEEQDFLQPIPGARKNVSRLNEGLEE